MFKDIDDAIKHERKMAKEYKETADSWYAGGCSFAQAEGNICLEFAKEHEQVIKWLEELKARREADRWIPVSERLPEDRKKVRVTAYWHERFQVMDASYYGDGIWWCVPFNNCSEHMRNDLHVIAWKHDDEPYESEADNETDN